jgi:NAD(P)H-flavin reductase
MAVPRKIRCVVHHIKDYGSGTYTLELISESRLPVFLPGQFLHLAMDEYDPSGFWPDSRPFSIASSPKVRDKLRISYSVKGHFTARMERELVEGKHVWIKLPYGEFVVNADKPTALIAGGTGITPFCSFLEDLRPNQANDIYLFYGARCADLLIYQDMLTKIAQQVSRLFIYYYIENAPDNHRPNFDFLPEVGCLAIEQIWSRLPDPLHTIYYLSGPPLMWKTFSQQLQERQVVAGQIRIDAWE